MLSRLLKINYRVLQFVILDTFFRLKKKPTIGQPWTSIKSYILFMFSKYNNISIPI